MKKNQILSTCLKIVLMKNTLQGDMDIIHGSSEGIKLTTNSTEIMSKSF